VHIFAFVLCCHSLFLFLFSLLNSIFRESRTARTPGKDADLSQKQRELAAGIAFQMAQHHERLHALDQAQACYAEALKLHESHDASLLAMARLQSQAGEIDQALQTAQMLLVSVCVLNVSV
jgi:tetratricopeptide (TPR) repeat protein